MNKSESLQPDTPDYQQIYALTCAPFENSGDPRFFYASNALMQRLDLLTHLTQFGESVVLVSGPPGSGKSTLLNCFMSQANARWQLCILDGDKPDQLADRLLSALGAKPGILPEAALDEWDARTDSSQLLVVIVDNTERLDPRHCENLCHLLAIPQGERLRFVLFGTQDAQPRVKDALQQQGSPQSLQVLEVPRLSEEETAAYLMYRLAVAGYSGESPFTATEVRAICKAADGRPAAINELAHQTLNEHGQRARSKREYAMRSRASNRTPLWLAATTGVLVLVAYAAWQRLAPPESPDDRAAEISGQPWREEVQLDIPEPVPQQHAANASIEAPAAASRESGPAPQLPLNEDAPLAPAESSATAAETEVRAETLAETPSAAPPPSVENTGRSRIPPAVPATPTMPESVATVETPPEIPEKSTAVQSDTPAEPVITKTAAAPAAADGKRYPHREDWLLQQPEDRYSLQLLGSRSEQSIKRFIREHKLDATEAAYYRGQYKNAEWYVLMYGVYPTRAAALQQAERLPAAIRKEQPWPRDMKSVHKAIQEVRQ